MKNKLGLMMAAMVIAGSVQVGLADPWDNYDFGKGNLENWDVLENGDNMEIVRDFEAKGGFYYRAKDVNQHAMIASPKFTIKEKHGILVIRYFRSGSTDCNLWLYFEGVDPVLLAGTSDAPTGKFVTKEFDLSSYVGKKVSAVLEGGSVNLDYLQLQERFGHLNSLLNVGAAASTIQLAISTEGTLHMTGLLSGGANLNAIDTVSRQKVWEYTTELNGVYSKGLETGIISKYSSIDNNGNIYFTNNQYGNERIQAINNNGEELWNFNIGAKWNNEGSRRPAIGKNGLIYLGNADGLYALDIKTGVIKWEFRGPHTNMLMTPAIGHDGTVYVGKLPESHWWEKTEKTFFALDGQTGSIKWGLSIGRVGSCSIGYDGTVYISYRIIDDEPEPYWESFTCALDGQTGEKLWQSEKCSYTLISNDGKTIFLITKPSNNPQNIVAVDSKTGDIKWKVNKIGNHWIVCNNGSIFTVNNKLVGSKLHCLSQNTGVVHWEKTSDIAFSEPVIGIDGTIYLYGSDGFIHIVETSSTGAPISPWPMVGQNAQRTSRATAFGDPQIAFASATISQGSLIDIDINFSGRGYTYPPDVRVVGGGGNGAVAKAFVSDGIVTDIIILNPGQGYTSAPSIEIDWPPFPPKQAFATPQITNGFLTGFNIEDPGSGYQNVPTVKIINENGSGAIAEAVLDKSKVVEIKVINPGSGYDSDAIVVIDPPPYPPSRASGEATVVNGFVISLTVTNEGRSYSSPPGVEIIGEGGSGAEAIAILEDGLVVSLTLLGAGSGYPNDTEVIIAPPEGFEQSFEIEELFIRPAVELEFLTLESKIYQLQWSTDLNNWNDDEHPFGGIGGLTSIFKSAGADRVYWRLKVSD